ncbi:MAG: hypothetical protein GC160_11245 [Acidobacteria bacterium]|nr:hypothetical protein [Acidobacteriota bacterium]
MIEALRSYFLRPGSALRLGVSRALFYGWYLLQARVYQPARFAELPAELWDPPVLLRLFPAPDAATAAGIARILELSLLLSCLGLWTRAATVTATVTGAYLFGVMNGYGFINFHCIPLVLISWPLALAPCGDAFSLDAWLRRGPLVRDPADYRWPIRLAQLTLTALMCTAGLRKVLGNWLSQPVENMRAFLLYKYYPQAAEKGLELPELTLRLLDYDGLLLVMAAGMVVCELGSPAALLDGKPWLRAGWIGGLFLMQLLLAVWLKTLPTFPWLGAYVFWVPWNRIGDVAGWARPPAWNRRPE